MDSQEKIIPMKSSDCGLSIIFKKSLPVIANVSPPGV